MSKLRVWWIPQVGASETFYIPVNSPEEGKKLLYVLAAYDMFQLQNSIKPDYSNAGGLQIWEDAEQEWNDWYIECDAMYYDDVDEYCESKDCQGSERLLRDKEEVFKQIDMKKIEQMTE